MPEKNVNTRRRKQVGIVVIFVESSVFFAQPNLPEKDSVPIK